MTARIEQLAPKDAEALKRLLTRDAPHNLFLLGLWEEFGLQPAGEAQAAFWGRFEDEQLQAAIFVGGSGGLVVPSASTSADVSALGRGMLGRVQLETALGEKSAVEALLRAMGVRPSRYTDQRLFSVSADDLGPFTNPTLRLATEQDVDALVPLAAGAVEERTGTDPRTVDAEGFQARVARRVRAHRTYVLESDGALVFKIDVGSRSQHGAELEGLYTLPSQRRRGHATLSLGQISRHLLSSLPRLTLRVDDENIALARIAQRVGYVARRAMRVAVASTGNAVKEDAGPA